MSYLAAIEEAQNKRDRIVWEHARLLEALKGIVATKNEEFPAEELWGACTVIAEAVLAEVQDA